MNGFHLIGLMKFLKNISMTKITGGFTTEGKNSEESLKELSDAGANIKAKFKPKNGKADRNPFEGKNVKDSDGEEIDITTK